MSDVLYVQIFVAGNHERSFDGRSADEIHGALHGTVTYLQDSWVEVEGLRVYGTPWTGERFSPADAFTVPYSELDDAVWSNIPSDTQILVTHCPPYGIMDDDGGLGCERLREAVFKRIR